MTKYRKTFVFNERVAIVRSGRAKLYGNVYSEYESNSGRIICVAFKSGVGIGFPAKQVRKTRQRRVAT